MNTASIVAIGGFSGAGKSSAARFAARQVRWPSIEVDRLARAIRGLHEFSEARFELIYGAAFECAFALLGENVGRGVSTIFDHNLASEAVWNSLEGIADAVEARFISVLLDVPWSICRSRVLARDGERLIAEFDSQRFKFDFLQDNRERFDFCERSGKGAFGAHQNPRLMLTVSGWRGEVIGRGWWWRSRVRCARVAARTGLGC